MPDHTIAENLTRLQTARTDIASAITTKGGTVAEGAGFEDFPTAIGTIPSGGSATLITKSITENGTYNASSDSADGYSSVTVAVPNTYSAGDEGKVVSNGALVAQTARPDTITTNGSYITTNYNSVTVNVPSGGDDSFAKLVDRSIVTASIPSGTTEIGKSAFRECGALASVTIPNTVTKIEGNAFLGCVSLTSLVIPASVTEIAGYSFYGCTSLTSIKFEPTTPPTMGSNAWYQLPTTCVIQVPTGSLTAYTSANNYPNPSTYTYVEY